MESSDAEDPYEQQLRAVFDSFDVDHMGSLDSCGLQLLCEQLPLDPSQSSDLISALAPQANTRVAFSQFRDGLLALLGEGLSSPNASTSLEKGKDDQISPSREDSPEREVSPKLVLGQKKYGRRSRPESADHDDITCEDLGSSSTVFVEEDKHKDVLQRFHDKTAFHIDSDGRDGAGGGEEEEEEDGHNPKKRRTGFCPEKYFKDVSVSQLENSSLLRSQGSLRQVEECLRLAWQQFGKNGFVNEVELQQVCEYIGIEKLSQEAVHQLFEQLDTNRDGKVSLEEFLHLFRSGVRWNSTSSIPSSSDWASSAISIRGNHSGGVSLNIVDCNGTGLVSADAIVEMWEAVGLRNPSLILRDLNFDESRPINVSLLASTLEEEIRQAKADSSSDSPTSSNQPEPEANLFTNNLLLAALSLRQAELRWLRSSMEQMICERDKLRNDLGEANQRANLLAQEIDEHHSKLERVSQNQVKLLEQKHSEAIRDLSMRLGQEREHLVLQNSRLEQKVAALQQSESKLTTEVASLRLEYETLDQESRAVNERLTEFEEANKKMENELQEMESLQQRFNELQANQEADKIQHLLDQVGKLRSENSSLRDRNDELTVELEVLTSRLASLKVKRQTVCASGSMGGGTKRRGNCALSLAPAEDGGDDGSPRVGKVPRRSHKPEISLDGVHIEGLQIHPIHSDSGQEADLDLDDTEGISGALEKLGDRSQDRWSGIYSENSSLGGSQDNLLNLNNSGYVNTTDQLVAHLQARVKELEQALLLCGSNIVRNHDNTNDLQGLKEVEEGAVFMCEEDTPASSLDVSAGGSDSFPKPIPESMDHDKHEETSASGHAVEQLQQHCRDLESQLDNVKIEIVKILSEKKACSKENCILKKRISDLCNQLPDSGDVDFVFRKDSSVSRDVPDCIHVSSCTRVTPSPLSNQKVSKEVNTDLCTLVLDFESQRNCSGTIERLKALEASQLTTIAALKDRCNELEKSLALMRDEYERCEDYWAGKLDEERQLAEQEQRITDEKFSELVSKIREYEELIADDHSRRLSGATDGRLETIDEQDGLEKQVTELEEELEDLRHQAEEQLSEKDKEITHLQEQLQLLQHTFRSVNGCTDVAVQASDLETGSWGSDRTFIVKHQLAVAEKTESHSSQSLLNCGMSDNTHTSPTTSSMSDSPVLRSDEDTRDSHSGAIRRHHQSRQSKIRHHPRYSALNCLNPQDELHALGLRLREQEQACVRLQRALRIQQQQAQTILQHTWDRHKQEVGDLQAVLQCTQDKLEQQTNAYRDQINKLTRSDILVKELYVENAHLLQSIQNLEQRFLVLSQQQMRISNGENCSSV